MKLKFYLQTLLLGMISCVAIPNWVSAEDDAESTELNHRLDSNLFEDSLAQSSSQTRKIRRQRQSRTQVVNSWVPYVMKNRYFQPSKNYFFSMDAGVGFLYFSGITANLQPTTFEGTGESTARVLNRSFQGKIGYNRTPVIEAMIGTRLASCVSIALSLMHQGGIYIDTPYQFYGSPLGSRPGLPVLFGGPAAYKFQSRVALDACLGKVYVNVPSSLIWKKISFNLYLGGGAGIGWQTWALNQVIVETPTGVNAAGLAQGAYRLKQKISANLVWQGDLGFKIRSLIPDVNFALRVGAKLIGWGQARQIGLLNQQRNSCNTGLMDPFRVTFVYSVAPYLGVQWIF